MKEKPILKPCPFCGGEAFATYKTEEDDGVRFHSVHCHNRCGAQMGTRRHYSEESAVDAWNARVDEVDAQRYRTVRASVTDKVNGAIQIAAASEAVGVFLGQYPTPEQFDQIIDRVAVERSGESS